MAERDRFDSVEVVVPPGMSEGFHDAIKKAGWTDDPGTGKSILTKDGLEIPNPQPMAPPLGYEPEDTLEDMVRRHLQKQLNLLGLRSGDVLDESPEEADDFDVEDDLPDLDSVYTVREMEPAAPALPPAPAPVDPPGDPGKGTA